MIKEGRELDGVSIHFCYVHYTLQQVRGFRYKLVFTVEDLVRGSKPSQKVYYFLSDGAAKLFMAKVRKPSERHLWRFTQIGEVQEM